MDTINLKFNIFLKPIITVRFYGRAKYCNTQQLIALGREKIKISWILTKLKLNKSKKKRVGRKKKLKEKGKKKISKIHIIRSHGKQHGGCEVRVNGEPPQILGGRSTEFNVQSQIVQSGNYCCHR